MKLDRDAQNGKARALCQDERTTPGRADSRLAWVARVRHDAVA